MVQLLRNGRSTASIDIDIAAIERLMSELQTRLDRLSGTAARTSSSVADAAGRAEEAISAVLSDVADKFGKRARATGDEAVKLGTNVMRRIGAEVEYRPVATLAVAVGIGFLLGFIGRRG
jgi:ElaB/YqjD/DUF883 family membrane-anchored ribosome-binding protein